jgi:hypothetical protein
MSSGSGGSSISSTAEDRVSKRRKELFGDCALIEIIHLHECLRGALKALEADVNELARVVVSGTVNQQDVTDLERRVAGRFKVIWSVFRAHSSAEDEFIWPALQSKTKGLIRGSPKYSPGEPAGPVHGAAHDKMENGVVEQEEYEEDHADEERMFSEMDGLLCKLREVLLQPKGSALDGVIENKQPSPLQVNTMARNIRERTKLLSQHLMTHLEKEETQCMPLVVKHMSKSEIHELVGQIMGKRSADTIAQIMTMAVQNLDEADREEMVKYMKQSMAGTFFDRWLLMSGWGSSSSPTKPEDERKRAAVASPKNIQDGAIVESKRPKLEDADADAHSCATSAAAAAAAVTASYSGSNTMDQVTSQAELEKLIRAIASNQALNPAQKNTTIQGLRDSVWKSNKRHKELHTGMAEATPTIVNASVPLGPSFLSHSASSREATSVAAKATSSGTRRVTPPSMFFQKNKGKLELVWSSESSVRIPDGDTVPLFSAAELAPTYHDGAAGTVLGCPHYSRACKLRHPKSGRLYACRLCCEQQRELPMKDQDERLDRYAVTEVMCMTCNALQPAEDRCINADCESRGKPFAKYFCRICHLYDDGSRPIFHCPYCNTCRLGLGLGIDFRHCMRCNACVSLADDDHHCIPQKLQGSCPICHETLFQSTEPLRGLKCGHVMHLACFTEYRRGNSYTCPLCMRSMEDMKDYFSLLDTAVRMQPMPTAYLSTMSNIYCQDCTKTGQVQYHFVGQKCLNCGSYNTREMGRVHNSPHSSPGRLPTTDGGS